LIAGVSFGEEYLLFREGECFWGRNLHALPHAPLYVVTTALLQITHPPEAPIMRIAMRLLLLEAPSVAYRGQIGRSNSEYDPKEEERGKESGKRTEHSFFNGLLAT
jgi:hypothetical protein